MASVLRRSFQVLGILFKELRMHTQIVNQKQNALTGDMSYKGSESLGRSAAEEHLSPPRTSCCSPEGEDCSPVYSGLLFD